MGVNRYEYLNNNKFSLFKDRLSVDPGGVPNHLYLNRGIEYKNNSNGYRSDDFSKDTAIKNFLFAGCSFTYALGLPYEFSWAYELNKDLKGENFYNLSSPGRGFQAIINDIYQYIRLFGKPKAIFVMFPSLNRTHVANFKTSDEFGSFYEIENIILDRFGSRNKKSPFDNEEDFKKIQKYTTVETLSYNFYNAVCQLEDYLEAIGVPLLWTTWDHDFAQSINGRKMFKDYFSLDFGAWEKNKKDNFYPPEGLGENRKYWLDASDGPNGHPGIMEQRWFATQFLNKFDGI
jgi:hypothetical protein